MGFCEGGHRCLIWEMVSLYAGMIQLHILSITITVFYMLLTHN
jgi:hypothetical protein